MNSLTNSGGITPLDYGTSYTVDQAAQQITRDNISWSPTLGQAATVTVAFRATDASYDNGVNGFSQFSSVQIDAAQRSMTAWSDVANIHFSRVGSGDTGAAAYSDSAKILFGDYQSGAPDAAAFTYLPDGTPSGGDVWVNGTLAENKNLVLLSYGQMTLTHEIGHSIGLEHPGDYDASDSTAPDYYSDAVYREDTRQYSVMSYFSETNTQADYQGSYSAVPLLDDIAAAQRLYGANWTTRATDTVYGFNSTADRPWFNIADASSKVIFCIWDGGGNDTIDLSGYTGGQYIDLEQEHFSNIGGMQQNVSIAKGVVIENGIGGSGDDVISGNAANNLLVGGAGSDALFGGAGDDTLVMGSGVRDVLDGGTGFDTADYSGADHQLSMLSSDDVPNIEVLIASRFNDQLPVSGLAKVEGGDGNDTFYGHVDGKTVMDGGNGTDTISADIWRAARFNLASFTSIENATGSARMDVITGTAGANSLAGEDGDDTLIGAGGGDTLDGGKGVDTASFAGSATPVNLNLDLGSGTIGSAHLSLIGIEKVIGTDGADHVVDGSTAVVLALGAGDDVVQLSGALQGVDRAIDGGAGIDTLSFVTAAAGVQVSLAGANGEVLTSVEDVVGSAYADLLDGSMADNTLDGRGGGDTLIGLAGSDLLIGGAGIDTVSFAAASAGVSVDLGVGAASGAGFSDQLSTIENVLGSGFGDALHGDGRANILMGGNGADTLTGGGGADTLVGGAGADAFVFTAVADSRVKGGYDLITDLEHRDVIDLSGIDANGKVDGNQAFKQVATFTHHAGELTLSYDSTSDRTALAMDVNGDGVADGTIYVAGDNSGFNHIVL